MQNAMATSAVAWASRRSPTPAVCRTGDERLPTGRVGAHRADGVAHILRGGEKE